MGKTFLSCFRFPLSFIHDRLMKNVFLYFLVLAGCAQPPADLSREAAREIWNRDLEMNALAAQEGFNKALLQFADDSLIKPQNREYPVVGKKALEAYYAGKEDTKSISWEPFKAVAARSGEIGYTLGNWKITTPDTTYHGNYYTMWKRQPDGTWKWTVDGGNNTPGEYHFKP